MSNTSSELGFLLKRTTMPLTAVPTPQWLRLSAAKTDDSSFTALLKLKDCEVDYINPSPWQSLSLAIPTGIIIAWRYSFQPFYTLQLSYRTVIVYRGCCRIKCLTLFIVSFTAVPYVAIYFTYHSYNPLLLFVFIALLHCKRMCYNLLMHFFTEQYIEIPTTFGQSFDRLLSRNSICMLRYNAHRDAWPVRRRRNG